MPAPRLAPDSTDGREPARQPHCVAVANGHGHAALHRHRRQHPPVGTPRGRRCAPRWRATTSSCATQSARAAGMCSRRSAMRSARPFPRPRTRWRRPSRRSARSTLERWPDPVQLRVRMALHAGRRRSARRRLLRPAAQSRRAPAGGGARRPDAVVGIDARSLPRPPAAAGERQAAGRARPQGPRAPRSGLPAVPPGPAASLSAAEVAECSRWTRKRRRSRCSPSST